MSTRSVVALALMALVSLAACGGGSDGSGLVSRPQYAEVVVVQGVGGSEDIRFDPVGTLYVESVGREVNVLEGALVGTIVVTCPPGVKAGGNQVNLGVTASVGRTLIRSDNNVLYLFAGADAGLVTITGDENTIYVEPAANLTVDDQGTDNVVVGL